MLFSWHSIRIEDFWSSVESAVVMIGDSTMEIRASPKSNEWLWIDGTAVSVGMEQDKWHTTAIAGFMIRYKESVRRVGMIREANLYLEGHKEIMEFNAYRSFVRLDVDWKNAENYKGSTGLLGSFDLKGLRVARDGVSPIQDPHKFGQEWQVLDSEPKLFHSYEGAVVGQKCTMPPTYTPELAEKMKRRLRASNLTVADAEEACNHLLDAEEKQACVFDVIATQDLSMAGAW
jgi:hypothetical protein